MKKLFVILFLTAVIWAENFPVFEEILPNGLTLLVITDTTVPDVSCRLYYFVGSIHENVSHTGLSHFFEHMMFKGTQRLGTTNFEAEVPIMAKIDSLDTKMLRLIRRGTPRDDEQVVALRNEVLALMEKQRQYIIKDEIWSIYERNGATRLNAWTSKDMTAYIKTLPANKVEIFANIESDRMQNLVLREFVSERDVVLEERRMRLDNRPVSNYRMFLESIFYSAHPYRNPIIGWQSDIENFTAAALRNYISRFYRPDNALIVLAGNITPQAASELINKYFAHIPNPDVEIGEILTREPRQIGEKRFIVREPNAESRVDILFHTPGFPDSAIFALDIVENMLSGPSGILHRRLVEQENLAVSAGAWNFWRHHNGMFSVWAVLRAGVSHERVEQIILEEIENLTRNEPSENELLRVKNTIRRQYLENFRNLESFSDQLAFFANLGNWRGLFEYQENIANVNSTTWAVEKYLNPRFRTVGWLINER